MSVCPPKDTSTDLNYDLERAENINLGKDIRQSLIDLSAKLLEEEELEKALKEENSFKEVNKYLNWYLGYSSIMLPYNHSYDASEYYFLHTTATEGSIATPWYGEQLSVKMLRKSLDYTYYIYPPEILFIETSNISLVVEMTMDTKETVGGQDYAKVYSNGEYKEYSFRYTGRKNFTKKYNISEFVQINDEVKLKVEFARFLEEDSLKEWKNKRMTGMTVNWHYENKLGKRVTIEGDTRYEIKDLARNTEYVRLVDILIHAVTEGKATEEEVWNDAKRFRHEWLKVEGYNAPTMYENGMVFSNILLAFIKAQEYKYMMTRLSTSEPMFKESATEAFLQRAGKTFIYLVKCPDPEIIAWNQFYGDLFINFPARIILQTVMDMYKLHEVNGIKRNIHGDLLNNLDDILETNYDKLAMVMDTSSGVNRKIDNGKLRKYNKEVKSCVVDGNCGESMAITEKLGGLQRFFFY